MVRYPIFTYPDLFTQKIDIKSYITECMGSAPSEPYKPTIEYPTKGCLIGLVFYIIVAVVISGGLPLSTTLPFGFASVVILWIVYFIISQIEFYKRLKVYNHEYNLYLQDIQLYNNRVELKQKDIELLQKNGDCSWKKQLINERLKNLTFKLSSGYGKKGASEAFFIQHLKEFFNCQIFQNPPIFCKEVGHKYYPDIVLFFDDANLAVAIEINEPYNLKDGKPIHYYCLEDDYLIFVDDEVYSPSSRQPFTFRSTAIINEGFVLIRFAEEQVVLQTASCCKFIYDKLKLYLGNDICKKNIGTIPDIKLVDAWTFLDAKKLHQEKYRENYLKRIDYFSSKRNDISRYDDLPF